MIPTNPQTFLDRDNWMRAVLASGLPDNAKAVALTIALHLRVKTGQCNPSYPTLAAESHMSERSTYRLVDLLDHSGWIAIQRTRGRLSNQYILRNPAKVESGLPHSTLPNQPANPDTVVRVNPAKSSVQPCQYAGSLKALNNEEREKGEKKDSSRSRKRSRSVTDSPPNQSGEKRKKEAAEEERKTSANSAPSASGQKEDRGDRRSAADDGAAAFDRFWAAYPRKKAKEAARKAFAKAVETGTAVETLIAGAQRYAVERNGENPKYTKHPATWLNGGCWEDETPGAPVIDQDGNVVGFEQPQQQEEDEEDLPTRVVREMREAGVSW
jgi:hypothetical protein